VYSNDFVTAIWVDDGSSKGCYLNERADGTVLIPFGSEYKVYLKNKHKGLSAVAKISIDGEQVSGDGYIVGANSEFLVERHFDGTNWDGGALFKFVERDSSEAVKAGKNGPDPTLKMGVVSVEWFLEKETPKEPIYVPWPYPVYPDPPEPRPWPRPRPPWRRLVDIPYDSWMDPRERYSTWCSVDRGVKTSSSIINKEGCTVEGDYIHQELRSSHLDVEPAATIITIKLVGGDTPAQPTKALRTEVEDLKKLEKLEEERDRLRKKLGVS
jgi:hypothetical protein